MDPGSAAAIVDMTTIACRVGAVRVRIGLSMPASASRAVKPDTSAKVARPLAFRGDAALATAAANGDRDAHALLFDRHAPHVRRVLARLLGANSELNDALHDVFVQVLRDIHKLQEPTALRAWITTVAVRTARGIIRRASRRRWLRIMPPEDVPERSAAVADEEITEALAVTYRILATLPADERIAFALRFIDGMELKEAASACDVSLATIKRRLQRAETTFVECAKRETALEPWLRSSKRWSDA